MICRVKYSMALAQARGRGVARGRGGSVAIRDAVGANGRRRRELLDRGVPGVHRPRADAKSIFAVLIKAGLQHTQGSYRKLVELFRMQPGDYKRFLAFLYQHDCHLPFHGFRGRTEETETRSQAR